MADGIDRRAANQLLAEFETVPMASRYLLEYGAAGRGNLRADAVAGEDRYQGLHDRASS